MKRLAAVITLVCTSAYGLTVQDLNVPGESPAALGLNNRGQVVGTFLPDFGFLWQNGTVTPLGDIISYAINDDGIIAGGSWQMRPLIKNSHTGVTTLIPVQQCENFVGAAVGISNSGFVVGHACGQAFRYRIGGSVERIGCPFPRGECYGYANAVNKYGVVGGAFNYNNASFYNAFFYNSFPFLLNSGIAQSVSSVNNHGLMAGLGVHGPFIFNGSQFLDVTLPKSLTGGYFSSINDDGVAVGTATIIGTNETRGIIYRNGVVTILANEVIAANDINNLGQIAGTAILNGQQKAVLILP